MDGVFEQDVRGTATVRDALEGDSWQMNVLLTDCYADSFTGTDRCPDISGGAISESEITANVDGEWADGCSFSMSPL